MFQNPHQSQEAHQRRKGKLESVVSLEEPSLAMTTAQHEVVQLYPYPTKTKNVGRHFGDAQRHFGAAQAHFESYYAHFGFVMDS
jgi:hypothetical protein